MPTIATFWHGPMSWLEALCIASFQRFGHPVDIYSFDKPADLPAGATWRDAVDILGRAELVFYKGKGTPAVFSDRFRLELLRRGRGIYADLDLYCLGPIAGPPDYLMAWERPGSINSAILHLPARSALLDDLIAVFAPGERPLFEPYLPWHRRLEVAARRLAGDPVPPEHMQYGATGPMALTYYVRRHGLIDEVRPASSFYPIPYADIPALMRPGSDIKTAIAPDTLGIHLWRSRLTDRGRADMPLPHPESALYALGQRHGIF